MGNGNRADLMVVVSDFPGAPAVVDMARLEGVAAIRARCLELHQLSIEDLRRKGGMTPAEIMAIVGLFENPQTKVEAELKIAIETNDDEVCVAMLRGWLDLPPIRDLNIPREKIDAWRKRTAPSVIRCPACYRLEKVVFGNIPIHSPGSPAIMVCDKCGAVALRIGGRIVELPEDPSNAWREMFEHAADFAPMREMRDRIERENIEAQK